MFSPEQVQRNIEKEKEILENSVFEFLEKIITTPVEFEIQYNPQKIWISNKGSKYENNGYYFNSRLGIIWKTPIVVITPILEVNEWINCKTNKTYLVNDLSNRGLGISQKNLHYFQKMGGVTSNYLREMFQHAKSNWKTEFHPDFKFDYNDKQSQFLYNLNESIKEISKGVFISSYVKSDPICASPITVYYTLPGRKTNEVNLVFEKIKNKYKNLDFSFIKTKEQNDVIDLYWNDLDPKNWDEERKKIEDEKKEKFRNAAFDKFVADSTKKYGEIYTYNLSGFTDLKSTISIYCNKHKLYFDTTPQEHLNGKRCPKDIESKGENLVSQILKTNNVEFSQYQKFEECFSKVKGRCYYLTFDFYLPKLNTLIEYDGAQHYKPVSIFGGNKSFERTQMLDGIKNRFAKKNKIKLIRIPYTLSPEEVEILLLLELGITD